MRMLILFNTPALPEDHPESVAERGVLDAVEAVAEHLARGGFEVDVRGLGRGLAGLGDALRGTAPDGVFNLFEGIADEPESEAQLAGELERRGVPFTGSPAGTLRRARDKPRAARFLRRAGVPVPDGFPVHRLPLPDRSLRWPLIVKPGLRDASEGITQESVVGSPAALETRVAATLRSYGAPVLVEEFVPGREFQVAVIETPELRALPASEIAFVDDGTEAWPIVTYDAKWRPGTRDYEATVPRYPATIPPGLAATLGGLAIRAHRLLGCRDYSRVDVRVSADGAPTLLEVNPNPDLAPTGCVSGGLASAEIDYGAFVVALAKTALARRDPSAIPGDN